MGSHAFWFVDVEQHGKLSVTDMNIKEELQSILRGEVEDSANVLQEYSRDASLFEVRPKLVVYPKDTKDIQELVGFVASHPMERLSITCRSAGTDMTGGPLGESIVVDMSRHFTKLQKVGKDYAVVQPGMLYGDFEKETAKHNLLLPSYPASKDICTVGGMVANNAGGEKTLHYGKTEEYVKELKVVFADGKEYVVRKLSAEELQEKILQQDFEGAVYRNIFQLVKENRDLLLRAKPKVSKNSAGYYLWNVWDGKVFDLPKLLAGSQGTLGIITEITFRLVVPKKHSTLLVLFLYDFAPLAKLTQKLLEHKPESLESYDNNTLQFALVHIPDFVKILKGNILSLAFQFAPEFWMFLRGGLRLPKLVVLAEFTGDSEKEIYQKAKKARDSLNEFQLQTRIAKSDKEEMKYLTVRRQSFNLLRHHTRGKRTAPFIDDLIVPPSVLPEFLPKLQAIFKKYPKLVYTVAGHLGDGNFHIIPLMDMQKKESKDIIFDLLKEVHELVFQYGGSMTAEHNDGIIRTPFLKDMYGQEVCDLFLKTKEAFDPKNILNPGKKVRGDLFYAFSHIPAKNK